MSEAGATANGTETFREIPSEGLTVKLDGQTRVGGNASKTLNEIIPLTIVFSKSFTSILKLLVVCNGVSEKLNEYPASAVDRGPGVVVAVTEKSELTVVVSPNGDETEIVQLIGVKIRAKTILVQATELESEEGFPYTVKTGEPPKIAVLPI